MFIYKLLKDFLFLCWAYLKPAFRLHYIITNGSTGLVTWPAVEVLQTVSGVPCHQLFEFLDDFLWNSYSKWVNYLNLLNIAWCWFSRCFYCVCDMCTYMMKLYLVPWLVWYDAIFFVNANYRSSSILSLFLSLKRSKDVHGARI